MLPFFLSQRQSELRYIIMKISINVPDNLSEITLDQYMQFNKIVDTNKDDPNAERFLQLKMLEVFCGLPYADAIKYKYTDVVDITNHLSALLSQKPELVRTFKMGGKEFGFVPKIDDLTFDEYTTIDSNIGDLNTMHIAMAVLYRPIKVGNLKTGYELEEYEIRKYWDAMRQMPLDAMLSAVVFFYELGKELLRVTRSYLEEMMKDRNFQQDLNLVENGTGILHSLELLTGILRNTPISLN